ncbi:MAG: 5-methyltetrahydropteroyltriglutamate--homocysteine S-methyltransferase [Chloroflexi bacterium]|nr:5-methyltetrahydropteroyltriglutamate--homocysteine S-methyltransferase [Chloroflexota bacterium]
MKAVPQLIGYPRIGPNRELKWLLERRWSGRIGPQDFDARIAEQRGLHLAEQRELIGSVVDDYFLYDEALETAMMFGAGSQAAPAGDRFDQLTALARGTDDHEAWEMTKWFDTNYHVVVPQLESGQVERFTPLPWRKPTPDTDVTWPVLGPYSLVRLSQLAPRTDERSLIQSLSRALADWVRQTVTELPGFRLQLDEPCLGLVSAGDDRALIVAAYQELAETGIGAPPIVTVQFGHASSDTVQALGALGFAVQIRLQDVAGLQESGAWDAQPEHVVSVMDGRSVWPDQFSPVQDALRESLTQDGVLRLVPTTSLMFLPVTVEGEDLPDGFQFAREKARALASWGAALGGAALTPPTEPAAAEWPAPGALHERAARDQRRAAQADLDLPPFPTTTTGSLPQTADVRHLRAQLSRGEIDRPAYDGEMARLISEGIGWQEAKGLDVLVHGEFERTDMVEFFAERMDGFHTTRNGWVLSYGSRCTRPPILAAPPSISAPMTVTEWQIAQRATSKPVKGMLTGPVTIVNWSFRPRGVPDDRLFWAVAGPIAEEVGHLVDAGARIVQVDEPAVRERWPLPTPEATELRAIYARGVRAALNRVFNQPEQVQMHTHMCYGDFGDIVPLWSDAGVDVASIEFSRSKDDSYIRLFYDLFADGHLQIGPGVFDVHSPYSPGREVMDERLRHFEGFMDVADLWVNPDCGLKTRGWDEIERQLTDMVEAARARRAAAQPSAAVAAESA